MLRLKESMRLYFSDTVEKHEADFALRALFRYFPVEPEPIENPILPSHAEKVMRYFAEKEKAADEIFKEAAGELKKLGKDDLIKRLKTAVTFYQSGDWIDDDNLARKNEH